MFFFPPVRLGKSGVWSRPKLGSLYHFLAAISLKNTALVAAGRIETKARKVIIIVSLHDELVPKAGGGGAWFWSIGIGEVEQGRNSGKF